MVLSLLGSELSVLGHHLDAYSFLIHFAHRVHASPFLLVSSYRDRLVLFHLVNTQEGQDLGLRSLYIRSNIKRPIVTTHSNYGLSSGGVSGK